MHLQEIRTTEFAFINGIVKDVETRKIFTKEKNFGDKIDAILTHPVSGLAIFAGIIFLVFYISQSTLEPGLRITWLAGLRPSRNGWAV